MNTLTLLDAGPWVSLQDLGRPGYQRYGISESGAADPVSLKLANRLLGNAEEAAALEIASPGLALRVEGEGVSLAASGPSLSLSIGDQTMAGHTTLHLTAGAVLRVKPGRSAVYAYLAIAGGLALAPQFGSHAFHARSRIGGVDGETLAAGTRLHLASAGLRAPATTIAPPPLDTGPIRVLRGPQAEHLSVEALERFFASPWSVDARSDRMGIRLTGPRLAHSAKGPDTISDGVVLGSLQLPGNGQPIVLGPDRQTTGGYPKFGVIARADLPRFFQTPPGAAVRFQEVSRAEAVAALDGQQRLLDRLRPAPCADAFDAERLLSLNLIDGIYGPGS